MQKVISILHISDLHRSQAFPISNTVLINSLEKDLERYVTNEDIPKPSLIIVSGDIVNGKGTMDEIYEQYEEAYIFLNELASLFLYGDKEKIVIVPGNHDINWNISKASMSSIPLDSISLEQKKSYYRLLKKDKSMRWSWENFEFLKVINQTTYDRRMEDFCRLYEKFYEGKRKYSLDPAEQYDIFNYPEFNLTIAGLNSCFRNDHCNLEGKINPDCIANMSRALKDYKYKDNLRFAVWHHNTEGQPNENNYMSAAVLQNLIESDFSLAFHGHQHKQEIVYESFKLNSNKKIVVVSSGSLCAGPDELPIGETRKYNLVRVDLNDSSINVHVRNTLSSNFDSPIWMPSTNYSSISLNQPHHLINDGYFDMHKVLEAEELIKAKDYPQALSLLEELDFENDFVRYLTLDCLFYMKDKNKEIIQLYMPPRGTRELMFLIHSIIEEKDKKAIVALAEMNIDEQLKDSSVREEYDKLQRRGIIWK